MAAYVIFIRNGITDPEGMATYAPLARAAAQGHAYERLVAYGACETLEGDTADGVVALRFETMAAARAWYDSSAYQDAAKIRQQSADYRVILAEGV